MGLKFHGAYHSIPSQSRCFDRSVYIDSKTLDSFLGIELRSESAGTFETGPESSSKEPELCSWSYYDPYAMASLGVADPYAPRGPPMWSGTAVEDLI